MVEAVNLLKECGARDIYMTFVHASLTANATEKMGALSVKQFITTDTIPITKEKEAFFTGRLRILTISKLIGEVIRRANEGRSVGELFNE
jgi:ribose-phosphate pyrophosphokinase